MTRFLIVLSVLPQTASAHLGHVGELAGHDHWVIGTAIGAAVAAGLWGAWKGTQGAGEDTEEPELQEA